MFISGTSGHACEDTQHKYPYTIAGRLLRVNGQRNVYELNLQQTSGGTITGSPLYGLSGTTFELSATPANKYTFDGFSVSGTTLTGSAGTYTNSDVTAKGNWTYHPEPVVGLTLPMVSTDKRTCQMMSVFGPNNYKNGNYPYTVQFKSTNDVPYTQEAQIVNGGGPYLPSTTSDYDGTQVVKFEMYPLITENYYTGSPSWVYDEHAMPLYKGNLRQYFGRNFTTAEPVTDKGFVSAISCPNGMKLDTSSFISAFRCRFNANVVYNANNNYRVRHDNYVSQWYNIPSGASNITGYFEIPCVSSNNPIIFEYSAANTGTIPFNFNFYPETQPITANAYYPSWSGKMCYLA